MVAFICVPRIKGVDPMKEGCAVDLIIPVLFQKDFSLSFTGPLTFINDVGDNLKHPNRNLWIVHDGDYSLMRCLNQKNVK